MERQSPSPESAEQPVELDAAAAERLQHLEQQAETASPEQTERRTEAAREAIARQPEVHRPEPESSRATSTSGLLNRQLNYRMTMQSLQRRLKPAGRTFSKIIHAPAVERTSEVLEQTVLRPSVSLGATVTAFAIGASTYFTARHYGFTLSGSEVLLALIAGGLIGGLIEGCGRLLRRQR